MAAVVEVVSGILIDFLEITTLIVQIYFKVTTWDTVFLDLFTEGTRDADQES